MRTRIRCPLCGALAWESQFQKAPHNIELFAMTSKSRGKGKGRSKFKFIRIFDKLFKHRTLEFLLERLDVINKYLKIQLGGNEWRKSESAWIRLAQDTSCLTMTPASSNVKINVTPAESLKTSTKNLKK